MVVSIDHRGEGKHRLGPRSRSIAHAGSEHRILTEFRNSGSLERWGDRWLESSQLEHISQGRPGRPYCMRAGSALVTNGT